MNLFIYDHFFWKITQLWYDFNILSDLLVFWKKIWCKVFWRRIAVLEQDVAWIFYHYPLRATAPLIAVRYEAWLQAPQITVKSELTLKHLTCRSDYCQNRPFRSSFWLFNLRYQICTNFLGQESLIMLGLCLHCPVNTNGSVFRTLDAKVTFPAPHPRSKCHWYILLLFLALFWANTDILSEAHKQSPPIVASIGLLVIYLYVFRLVVNLRLG